MAALDERENEIKAKKDMGISKHGARSDIPALMGIKF